MKTNTILITGGDGFTGQHASKYFKSQGYNVITTTKKNKNKDTFKINLNEREKVSDMIEKLKPQSILHLAGQNDVQKSWSDPLETLEANVVGTMNIIEAVRKVNPQAKMVIVGSILENYSSHPYGLSKALQALIATKWVDFYNLNITIAKPVNLIGPGFSNGVCAMFAKKIACLEAKNKTGKLIILNQKIKRDFLDVRDAIRSYETLLLKGERGETYDIGSGRMVSIMDIATIYKQLSDYSFEIEVKNEPAQLNVPEVNPNPLRSLGWHPLYALHQSLSDCLNFYRKNTTCGGDETG